MFFFVLYKVITFKRIFIFALVGFQVAPALLWLFGGFFTSFTGGGNRGATMCFISGTIGHLSKTTELHHIKKSNR
jgi:hypothetical protein